MSNTNELKSVLEQLENEEIKHNNKASKMHTKKKTNADWLEVVAYINIVISIIGSTCIFVKLSEIEYSFKPNMMSIFATVGILLAGFTLFFLLKTVVDIYKKVEK